MYKILIVEDDSTIAERISANLQKWELSCVCVQDFRNVTVRFAEENPHLVIMDISLPCYDGYHWCGEIRRLSKVPILFLSSAADNMNIVMAISTGADDFIAKPFDMSVLLAKVQALLRRTYDFSAGASLLTHGGVILNLADSSLTSEGTRVELTRNESRILQVLLENSGKTVSRDRLMQRLWESDSYIDENTLTVNINRLRKKLTLCGKEDLIVTRKGLGYAVE